jgi:transcriptional regulator of acetoin/glycerol metabolism
VAEAERRILESALKACNGNVVEAARRLGIGRATFYRKTRPGIPRIGK